MISVYIHMHIKMTLRLSFCPAHGITVIDLHDSGGRETCIQSMACACLALHMENVSLTDSQRVAVRRARTASLSRLNTEARRAGRREAWARAQLPETSSAALRIDSAHHMRHNR
jgi:hypothetical protein